MKFDWGKILSGIESKRYFCMLRNLRDILYTNLLLSPSLCPRDNTNIQKCMWWYYRHSFRCLANIQSNIWNKIKKHYILCMGSCIVICILDSRCRFRFVPRVRILRNIFGSSHSNIVRILLGIFSIYCSQVQIPSYNWDIRLCPLNRTLLCKILNILCTFLIFNCKHIPFYIVNKSKYPSNRIQCSHLDKLVCIRFQLMTILSCKLNIEKHWSNYMSNTRSHKLGKFLLIEHILPNRTDKQSGSNIFSIPHYTKGRCCKNYNTYCRRLHIIKVFKLYTQCIQACI